MDRHGWDDRYRGSDHIFPREPNRLVAGEVATMRPGTALDLAAGEGRHAVWLASLGWRVVAVDYAEVGLRRAQSRARAEDRQVAFALADVHTLRLPPRRFDLVLAAFFHPRPPERAAVYSAAAACLAPGGSLLLVSYDKANLTAGSGGPQDPDLLLDPPVLAADLAALGLRVVRAETVRLDTPSVGGGLVPVVDAVLRAVRP